MSPMNPKPKAGLVEIKAALGVVEQAEVLLSPEGSGAASLGLIKGLGFRV